MQIKPLVGPTKAIMDVHITIFQWHEFFPRGNGIRICFITHSYVCLYELFSSLYILISIYVLFALSGSVVNCYYCFAAKNNIGVVIALWAPIILVWIRPFDHPIYVLLLIQPSKALILIEQLYCRSILWMHRFGMQYFQHCLEVFMEHFVDLERLTDHFLILNFSSILMLILCACFQL